MHSYDISIKSFLIYLGQLCLDTRLYNLKFLHLLSQRTFITWLCQRNIRRSIFLLRLLHRHCHVWQELRLINVVANFIRVLPKFVRLAFHGKGILAIGWKLDGSLCISWLSTRVISIWCLSSSIVSWWGS